MKEYTPSNFINRELSWLRFNTRVFEEALSSLYPPLEQLKFIAIFGTNLDEFYMIRVAGLLEMEYEGVTDPSTPDGLTVQEQLTQIRQYINQDLKRLESRCKELFKTLEKRGLNVKQYQDLSQELQKKANEYFHTNIFPVIIPIAVNSTHPFPHLNNLSFAMGVKLKEISSNLVKFGLIRIPRVLPRFIELEDGLFVPIESIVYNFIGDLFPGFTLLDKLSFRVTRNADIVIAEEEADDFLMILEEGLKLRRKGKIVRVEFECATCDEELKNFLISHLEVDKSDVYEMDLPLNLGSYWQLVGAKGFGHLLNKPYTPKTLAPFQSNLSIFTIIDREDIIQILPFESFNPVEKFIIEAATDPQVLSIRMTLYRVGSNSKIVKALIEAAEQGKMVTAVVELKARFDEENNLRWAKALERAGAHVIYGVKGLKIHAKIAHVIRRSSQTELKHYVHLSTGNYNPTSAKIYTDISFFSSNQDFAEDAIKFFHHITGFSKETKLSHLKMSPTEIKPKILELIKNEMQHKEKGEIIAKVNSLVDPVIIEALYKASAAGVKISLIVRGICCLRPGVKDLSENISVISIVGKYLEHARVFYFKNATPKVYFASADWMTRNLDRRIELFTPVENENIMEMLEYFLRLQLLDNSNAKILDASGNYTRQELQKGQKFINSQALLEKFYMKTSSANEKYYSITQKIKEFLG